MNKIVLRDWQQDALEKASLKFDAGQKLFLTHATPGGGKTIHGLSVFDQMRNDSKVTHLVVLAPSTTLVNQWQADAKTIYGFELKNAMLYNQMADFREYHGIIMTYQGMNECHESLRIFCDNNDVLVVGDEIHHVADGQSWGDSFRNAFEPAAHILALTGTPWGSNGKRIAYIEYGEDGFAIPDFSYDKKTAIRDKVCRVTQFVSHSATDLCFINEYDGEISEYSTLESALEAKQPRAYQKTLSSLQHMKAMFLKADDQLGQLRGSIRDAGGLIVAPSIEAAHAFKDEIFMLTGIEYNIVHSKMDSPHQTIRDFRKSNDRWLISVDMVTEGVDIKRLMVCVFLSTKNTELFLRQVIGRIERVRYPGSDADGAGFFHHTDVKEINEIVGKLLEENKAGVALKEAAEKDETPSIENGPRPDDVISLADVRTVQNGLIANGYYYPDDVVIEAMKRHRSSVFLADLPLYVVCKMVMSEREVRPIEKVDESTYYDDVPLTEKKSRLRSKISKEITRKLMRHMNGKMGGNEIKLAHWTINQKVGITKTDDDVSLEQLERKLQFITETGVPQWLA